MEERIGGGLEVMCMGSERESEGETVRRSMRVKQVTGSHWIGRRRESLDQHQPLCRARRTTRSPPPRRHHSLLLASPSHPARRAHPTKPQRAISPIPSPISHLASPVPALLFAPRTCSRLRRSVVLFTCSGFLSRQSLCLPISLAARTVRRAVGVGSSPTHPS